MRANSLWRSLPLGARIISLLPIVTFLITSTIFFYLDLEVVIYRKGYHLIGSILWLGLASFFIVNLWLESTEKRPAGLLQVPPMTLIAFNVVSLCLVFFIVYHVLTNLHLYIWSWEGWFLTCNILSRESLMAWGMSFALGNLLLHAAYAEFWVLKGRLGVLARRFSFLNGMIAFAVFVFSVFIAIVGILCAGPGS